MNLLNQTTVEWPPIVELRRAISEARFATFLAGAHGDERKAWALHE